MAALGLSFATAIFLGALSLAAVGSMLAFLTAGAIRGALPTLAADDLGYGAAVMLTLPLPLALWAGAGACWRAIGPPDLRRPHRRIGAILAQGSMLVGSCALIIGVVQGWSGRNLLLDGLTGLTGRALPPDSCLDIRIDPAVGNGIWRLPTLASTPLDVYVASLPAGSWVLALLAMGMFGTLIHWVRRRTGVNLWSRHAVTLGTIALFLGCVTLMLSMPIISLGPAIMAEAVRGVRQGFATGCWPFAFTASEVLFLGRTAVLLSLGLGAVGFAFALVLRHRLGERVADLGSAGLHQSQARVARVFD